MGVAALVILAALIWFVPYLTLQRPVITGVPAPAALAVLTEFAVSPGESACMGSVAVEPNARTVTFGVRPMKLSGSGPPINVVLNATNYRAVGHLASGYPGGVATVAITPPPRNVIGSVCFVNVGKKKALLDGTDEARTMTRSSPLVIAGKPVEGDIALSFTAGRTESYIAQLGEVFQHASNLTDGLVPTWFMYIVALLVVIGVPIAIVTAVYLALREEESMASSRV